MPCCFNHLTRAFVIDAVRANLCKVWQAVIVSAAASQIDCARRYCGEAFKRLNDVPYRLNLSLSSKSPELAARSLAVEIFMRVLPDAVLTDADEDVKELSKIIVSLDRYGGMSQEQPNWLQVLSLSLNGADIPQALLEDAAHDLAADQSVCLAQAIRLSGKDTEALMLFRRALGSCAHLHAGLAATALYRVAGNENNHGVRLVLLSRAYLCALATTSHAVLTAELTQEIEEADKHIGGEIDAEVELALQAISGRGKSKAVSAFAAGCKTAGFLP